MRPSCVAKEVFRLEREIGFHLAAFASLAVGGAAAFLVIWLCVDRRRRLLPLPRRPRGDWSGHEVILTFILFLSIIPLVLVILQKTGFYERVYPKLPSLYRQQLWVWILATPLTIACTFLTLYSLSRTRPPRYGMTLTRAVPNIMAGYLVWLALTPLVLGLFLLVMQWIPPEDHPLAELGRSPNLMPTEWALMIFQAVVGAPLLEELAFRGVLLGWLRRATVPGHVAVAAVALGLAAYAGVPTARHQDGQAEKVEAEDDDYRWGPVIFVATLVPLYLGPVFWIARRKWQGESERLQAALPVNLPLEMTPSAPEEGAPSSSESIPTESMPSLTAAADSAIQRSGIREETKWDRLLETFAPICGSSILFAAFHAGVWPSPIPLFVLALGLGWLALRTGSLVGPIVAHMLFNTVASIVLILSAIYPEETNGNAATTASRPSLSGSIVNAVPASQLPRLR
jgi:membrane protease YdiL (CAAX protease family)